MAIDDERARQAMREFADLGIVSGESGAAGLAALLKLLHGPDAPTARQRLGINRETRVLVFLTEGATDPVAYEQIVGRTPAAGQ
jgi:diaminopropionate ammonia-lyase